MIARPLQSPASIMLWAWASSAERASSAEAGSLLAHTERGCSDLASNFCDAREEPCTSSSDFELRLQHCEHQTLALLFAEAISCLTAHEQCGACAEPARNPAHAGACTEPTCNPAHAEASTLVSRFGKLACQLVGGAMQLMRPAHQALERLSQPSSTSRSSALCQATPRMKCSK